VVAYSYSYMCLIRHPTAKNRPTPGVISRTLQKSDRTLLISSVQVTDDVTSESQSMMLELLLLEGTNCILTYSRDMQLPKSVHN